MKAAVAYDYGQPLQIEDLACPQPGPAEVLVRIGASGVCHSDLHAAQGYVPVPLPAILGHEGAGTVEALGPGVTGLQPGDHVVLSWVPACGTCWYCLNQREHLCELVHHAYAAGEEMRFSREGTAISRFAGVSSFGEYTVVRAAGAIPIPADLPFDVACLIGCGVMTGAGAAINTAKVQPGQTVAVFGAGGVGLNVIQGAALCGASQIIAVDKIESKLETARRFGATHALPAGNGDCVQAIKDLTSGYGAEVAFEVVGDADIVMQAFLATRRGGKVVIVGIPGVGQPLNLPAIMLPLEEKAVVGSLYGSAMMRRDVPRLIALYRAGKLKLDELISRRITLAEVNLAFAALERGDVARSVIVF